MVTHCQSNPYIQIKVKFEPHSGSEIIHKCLMNESFWLRTLPLSNTLHDICHWILPIIEENIDMQLLFIEWLTLLTYIYVTALCHKAQTFEMTVDFDLFSPFEQYCLISENLLKIINSWSDFEENMSNSWWRHQMKTCPRYWPFVRGINRSLWILRTKASDAELWCFLWSAPE